MAIIPLETCSSIACLSFPLPIVLYETERKQRDSHCRVFLFHSLVPQCLIPSSIKLISPDFRTVHTLKHPTKIER